MPLPLSALGKLRVVVGQEDVTPYLGENWSFSSVDPGGFEACSLTFPRDMDSTIRGLPIRIDSGLKVAWEGRVAQVQRSLGHNTLVTGEGYGARLKDVSRSMVFADRDLTRWGSPSLTRQANLAAANQQLGSSQVAADPTTNTPAIVQAITDSWVAPFNPICEAWYDGGPQNLITTTYYHLVDPNAADTNWVDELFAASDANAGSVSGSGNLASVAGVSGYFSPALARRFWFIQRNYGVTPAGAQGGSYNGYWHLLATYGSHGLTGRGPDPVGFYPSDIVTWVLAQIPGLQAGMIQQTDAAGYIMPHSVYYTLVTLDTMVGDMATAQGWHWGVWESLSPLTGSPVPRVDFRPRPQPGAFTAFCLRRDCETLDIREDLSQQFNQAVVTFNDVAGVQNAVTVTADNPVLDAAGIPSRTVVFQGGTMTAATAALFGAEALALTNAQARVAGTADIIAPIDGGVRPAWELKAGIDRLRIGDAPTTTAFGTDIDYPLSRIETSISSSGFTTSVEVGTGAQLVESLQARLASATALAGNGGA